MPHATAQFKFEHEVFGATRRLVNAWRSDEERDSFLMLLDPFERVIQCRFYECHSPDEHDSMRRLRAEASSFLLYDPFDAPEYYWLQWKCISRPVMERLLNFRFDAEHLRSTNAVFKRKPGYLEFPHTHGVMF